MISERQLSLRKSIQRYALPLTLVAGLAVGCVAKRDEISAEVRSLAGIPQACEIYSDIGFPRVRKEDIFATDPYQNVSKSIDDPREAKLYATMLAGNFANIPSEEIQLSVEDPDLQAKHNWKVGEGKLSQGTAEDYITFLSDCSYGHPEKMIGDRKIYEGSTWEGYIVFSTGDVVYLLPVKTYQADYVLDSSIDSLPSEGRRNSVFDIPSIPRNVGSTVLRDYRGATMYLARRDDGTSRLDNIFKKILIAAQYST